MESAPALPVEDMLDEVGKLMLLSARTFAAAGKRVPVEYIARIRAHKKQSGI